MRGIAAVCILAIGLGALMPVEAEAGLLSAAKSVVQAPVKLTKNVVTKSKAKKHKAKKAKKAKHAKRAARAK